MILHGPTSIVGIYSMSAFGVIKLCNVLLKVPFSSTIGGYVEVICRDCVSFSVGM